MIALSLFMATACLAAPAPELPHGPTPKVYALVRIVEAGVSGNTAEEMRKGRVDALKDRSVLQDRIERGKLLELETLKKDKDPGAWLQQNLVVEFIMPEVLRIGINCPNNKENVEIVNRIARATVDAVLKANTPERLRSNIEGDETRLRQYQEKILSIKELFASPPDPLDEASRKDHEYFLRAYEYRAGQLEIRIEQSKHALRNGLPIAEIIKYATIP